MQEVGQFTENSLTLEAPGDFLSELLGVQEASVIQFGPEGIRSFPSSSGIWRILAPESGCIRVAWNDQTWDIASPHAAVFPGGEELSLFVAEVSSLKLLCLCGTAADKVFSTCRQDGGLFFETGGIAVEHTFSLLSPGGSSSAAISSVSALDASAAAYGLLMDLFGTQSAEPGVGKQLPTLIEAALGIIRQDYAFLDGIANLAERLEVSQEYLTRSFCRYIGITPGKYLTRVRIENARLLLRQGKYSVQFVAEACGFTNANYFARVFRSAVGMNPAEYARRHPLESDTFHDEELYVL